MKAIQDQIPNNHCYGCGPENAVGLRIKSYRDSDETVCRYQPRPEQCAGPTQFVYGGTIASLIDCHSVGTAIAHFYQLENREIGTAPEIWCVTGKLTVNYLAPTPMASELVLRARIESFTEKKAIVSCDLIAGETTTASGEVIAIRVADDWRDAPR